MKEGIKEGRKERMKEERKERQMDRHPNCRKPLPDDLHQLHESFIHMVAIFGRSFHVVDLVLSGKRLSILPGDLQTHPASCEIKLNEKVHLHRQISDKSLCNCADYSNHYSTQARKNNR